MNPPTIQADTNPDAPSEGRKQSTEPVHPDIPQPVGDDSWLKANRKKLGVWIGLVVLIGFGLNAFFNRAPDTKSAEDPEPKQVGGKTSAETGKLNKAQWRAKLADKYGALVEMGTIAGWDKVEFQQLMGAPSKTQSVEGTALWYFECSDGTIQLELNSGALSAGLMQGKINDY